MIKNFPSCPAIFETKRLQSLCIELFGTFHSNSSHSNYVFPLGKIDSSWNVANILFEIYTVYLYIFMTSMYNFSL